MLSICYENENGDKIVFPVGGRIDTLSADESKEKILSYHERELEVKFFVYFEKVEIISNCCLRELLRFIKQGMNFKLTNVNADVFSVPKQSRFLNYMEIERPIKHLSLEICELTGKGVNAEVYKLNDKQVIKVFNRKINIDMIIRKKQIAKKAIMEGIPSAISFEMAEVKRRIWTDL